MMYKFEIIILKIISYFGLFPNFFRKKLQNRIETLLFAEYLRDCYRVSCKPTLAGCPHV